MCTAKYEPNKTRYFTYIRPKHMATFQKAKEVKVYFQPLTQTVTTRKTMTRAISVEGMMSA